MSDIPPRQTKPGQSRRVIPAIPATVVVPPPKPYKNPKPRELQGGMAEPPPMNVQPELDVSEQHRWRSELTQGLVDELIGAARVGGFKRSTAISCGVRPETLEWWLDEGMRADAPELQQQLSARFLSCQEGNTLRLVEVINRCALSGDWEAALALLKQRDPMWRGSDKFVERDNAPPELSQEQRYRMLVEQFKDPQGDLARAMREAGIHVQGPALPNGESE